MLLGDDSLFTYSKNVWEKRAAQRGTVMTGNGASAAGTGQSQDNKITDTSDNLSVVVQLQKRNSDIKEKGRG